MNMASNKGSDAMNLGANLNKDLTEFMKSSPMRNFTANEETLR